MAFNLFSQPVSRRGEILGCSSCPLDKALGIRKVKGLVRIKGRKAMLWATAPGEQENAKGMELVGPAGDLLWKTMKPAGLTRDDFDVQNVVRCRPVDEMGYNRDPSKRELACCSPYNDEARELNRGNAAVHLILGDVAGLQLLEKDFRKDKPVFWHPPWEAYVVLGHHPSYILRQGGGGAGWEYYTWRDRFRAVKACLDNPGRWGYVKSRKYKAVRTMAEFDAMEKALRAEQVQGRRVSFDIEDGTVDGKRVLLLAGFGIGHLLDPKNKDSWNGECWSVIVDHPEAQYQPTHTAALKARVKKLVEDGDLKKALQNGSYEQRQCQKFLGTQMRGYTFDTMYGAYLRHSFLRSCSLENLTYCFFPEFADYKNTTDGYPNFADVPLDLLLLRNGGDCDVTKRLEEKFSSQVSNALMQVYIRCGVTLDKMEGRGPLLDWENWGKANEAVPKMIAKLDRQLQHISGDPNFDCDSSKRVAWLIYDVLKLPVSEDGRSTRGEVLDLLAAETGNPTLEVIQKRRGLRVMQSTFLTGYARCAKENSGELRSRWFLTGAVTGRLRSGGGTSDHRINMQNIHGNPLLRNIIISDSNWRSALEISKNQSLQDLHVFLSADGSQIELRALAELSRDKLLTEQFQKAALNRHDKKLDVHCQVGHTLTGWPVERIASDKKTRRMVKELHFGIVFGLNEGNVHSSVVSRIRARDGAKADLTGITKPRMVQLYRNYFKKYPGVKRYQEETRAFAEKHGYVETLFGFRREIRSGDGRGSYVGNQAINTPVQGTAHQFLLIAMALLDLKPRTYNLLQRCLMEVHDALYFRVRLGDLVEAYKQLMHLFEVGAFEYAQRQFHIKLNVPLLAEAEAGFCMGSMISYNGEPLSGFLPAWREKQREIESKSWEDMMPSIVKT